MRIKVVIADGHAIVREGIGTVIARKTEDITVVGEAADGKDVLELAKKIKADVYILDISLPLLNGIETAHRLLEQDPHSGIIILSMHADSSFVEKALLCGVRSYLLKEDARAEIITAIREVKNGRYFLSPCIYEFVVQGFLNKSRSVVAAQPTTRLSAREREVLQLISAGETNNEIAGRLDISLNTVLTHRKNIMSKLGAHRQADLIRFAIKEAGVGL
ncbi:response regulator [Thermodesulfobacteriota bacterium]